MVHFSQFHKQKETAIRPTAVVAPVLKIYHTAKAVISQGNEFIAIFHAACLIIFDVSLSDKLQRSYSTPEKFTENLLLT